MKQTQKQIQKQKREEKKAPLVAEEKIIFSYTDRYLKRREIMKNAAPFVFIVGMFPYSYIIFSYFKESLFFLLFAYLILGLIGMYKYGKPFYEYQKGDIYIQNNRIHLKRHTRLRFDYINDCLRVDKIRRVVVKKYSVVIYGDILDTHANQLMMVKKLIFPKEIENIDEFIRFAQSQVVRD